jgi:putative chitinase
MEATTLAAAMNIPLARAQKWAPALTLAMADGKINTRLCQAAFLAQIGHESGSLLYSKELGGPSYFAKYDGRKDLGNTQPGDGARFAGRGLIQVTGRANYVKCSQALFGDDRLLKNPELLEQPEWAAKSAAWYWSTRNLNALADQDRFTDITRAINGGTNGLEDRKARYRLALSVLV